MIKILNLHLGRLIAEYGDTKEILSIFGQNFSRLSNRQLWYYLKSSQLVAILQVLQQLILSAVVYDEDFAETLRSLFNDFSIKNGKRLLCAIFALLELLKVPSNELSDSQIAYLEETKTLLRSSLFHDVVVIHLMQMSELAHHQAIHPCNCEECRKKHSILTFGWLNVAQEAHSLDMFQRSEG